MKRVASLLILASAGILLSALSACANGTETGATRNAGEGGGADGQIYGTDQARSPGTSDSSPAERH